jgi:hypothetical protein
MKKVLKLVTTMALAFGLTISLTNSYAGTGTYREMVGKQDAQTILKQAGMLSVMADNCGIGYDQKDHYDTIIHDTILATNYYSKMKAENIETIYKGSLQFYASYTPELCTEENIKKISTDIDLWNTSFVYQKVQELYAKPEELRQLSGDYIYRHKFVPSNIQGYDAGYNPKTGKAWIYHPMSYQQCHDEISPNRKQSCMGNGLKEDVLPKN